MSKRKFQLLVNERYVSGWDDPRLLTIAGLRRRGYTPESIRNFCASVGIAKANSTVDMAQLEFAIRDDLNFKAPRVLAVLEPLKVTICNYPEGKVELIDAPYYPEDVPKKETRPLPFTKEIYIERSDFMENPPKGFFRLSPGGEVRLRYGYIIKCQEVVKNERGEIVALRCTYDEKTPLGENPSDGRRVKGTIHWVSATEVLPIEARLYERLFTAENPGALEDEAFISAINPESLMVYKQAFIEPSVRGAPQESHFQFERLGFFVTDLKDSTGEKLVFNRTVPLKDSWSKQVQAEKKESEPQVVQKPQKVSEVRAQVELTGEQQQLAERYQKELELPKDDAEFLAADSLRSTYFEEALQIYRQPKLLANWIINELQREFKEGAKEGTPLPPQHLAELVKAIDTEAISSKIAKEVYAASIATGMSPSEVIKDKGLSQITDSGKLAAIIDRLVAEHSDVVEQIRAGRTNRISFFVGQVMKATKGMASPKVVNELLEKKLFGD